MHPERVDSAQDSADIYPKSLHVGVIGLAEATAMHSRRRCCIPTVTMPLLADGLGAWLLAAPAGQAVALFGADAAAARSALAAAELPLDRRLCVVFALDIPTPAEAVAERAAVALAATALAAFPHWYCTDQLAGIGVTNLEISLLVSRLSALHDTIPDLSPLWARRAVARALASRPGAAARPRAAARGRASATRFSPECRGADARSRTCAPA